MRYIVRGVSWKPERLENIENMKKQIPNLEVFLDYEKDGYKLFLQVMDSIKETGGIVLEDDAILCKNFVERIEKLVNQYGNGKDIINFFEKPKSYFKTSYVGGSGYMWAQCVYYPPNFTQKIINEYENFKITKPKKWQGMAFDSLTAHVLTLYKIKYWRVRPTLVQHANFDSAIGGRPNNRQTIYFIDDLEKKGIDYETMGY